VTASINNRKGLFAVSWLTYLDK